MSFNENSGFLAAQDAIRRRFSPGGANFELAYDRTQAIETERWWYIPVLSIGSKGFIVNKTDLYVNWLGSGLSLGDCFWGHDHGLFCDLVDFTFHKQTEVESARKLVVKFQHMHPNAEGRLPGEPVWYRETEVEAAVAKQFPVFKRHFVWFAIPDLHAAWTNSGLRFRSILSKGIKLGVTSGSHPH